MRKINHNLFHIVSNENFWKQSSGKFYLGIDPTAESIHVGHLISIRLAIELLKNNFNGIILVGGFTGRIGDPTDKTEARQLLLNETVNHFSGGILTDIKRIFAPFTNQVEFVNNKDWLINFSISEYFELAKHVSVTRKLHMETFKNRLDNNLPLSLGEFLYSDLQMIDFWYLYKHKQCNIQIGGQDQWGNISFGVHALHKITQDEDIFGICTPLLLDQNNKKISKSEGKPPFLKSPYDLYQFLYRSSEAVKHKLAELFDTSIDCLIEEIFRIAYPDDYINILSQVEQNSKDIFYNDIENCPEEMLLKKSANKLSKMICDCNLSDSISKSKQLIQSGAVYINKEKQLEDVYLNIGMKFKLSVGKLKHVFISIV